MMAKPGMRMIACHAREGDISLSLAQGAIPLPGAGQVRIKVAACGINYPDVLMLEGRYQFPTPNPFVPGIEIAGVIDAVGQGVAALAVGMRVAAQVDYGGLAEYALASAERTYALPEGLGEMDAAARLLTYGTSFHALRDRAALKAGDRLLVLGAGGGVGLAAVALGKWLGAHVTAGASTPAKLALARAAGADENFLYPAQPDSPKSLAALIKQACPNGADVIYDPVGGDHSEAALRSIRPGGRYLVVGFPAGIARLPLNLVLLKNCSIVGVFWGDSQSRWPQASRALIEELLELLAQRALDCPAPTVFALEEAKQAIAALKERRADGKIVVCPGAALDTDEPQRLDNEDLP